MPVLDSMLGHRRLRRLRHDRDRHPRHQRQAGRLPARALDGPRHAGLRVRGRRQGDRRAVRRGRDRRALAAGHPGHPAVPRVLRQRRGQREGRSRTAGSRPATWWCSGTGGNLFYRERDKDLLKVGGENVSAREVEDVVIDRRRRRPGGRGGQAPRLPRPGRRGLRDHGARRVRRRRRSRSEIIETCRRQLADFKVPRAVYVVDEFPLGTLDKILKNKLREMADERDPV